MCVCVCDCVYVYIQTAINDNLIVLRLNQIYKVKVRMGDLKSFIQYGGVSFLRFLWTWRISTGKLVLGL